MLSEFQVEIPWSQEGRPSRSLRGRTIPSLFGQWLLFPVLNLAGVAWPMSYRDKLSGVLQGQGPLKRKPLPLFVFHSFFSCLWWRWKNVRLRLMTTEESQEPPCDRNPVVANLLYILFFETIRGLSFWSILYTNFLQPKVLLINNIKCSTVISVSDTQWVIHVGDLPFQETYNLLQCEK